MSSDVKGSLNWANLGWDLDGLVGTPGITFTVGDVTSAIITSATKLTVTLTDAAAAAMESTVGFAFDGLGATNTADNVDVGAKDFLSTLQVILLQPMPP